MTAERHAGRRRSDYSDMFNGRPCVVVDGLIEHRVAVELETIFSAVPYSLSDIDRPDTAHVRHFVYRFDENSLRDNAVVGFLEGAMRETLDAQGITGGPILRAYVNLNMYGDQQFAHYDGDEWTGLFFLCSEWKSDWGGELMVYSRDGSDNVALAIEPQPGRLVVFDGKLLHRGGCPSKRCDRARMSLAIKMQKKV